MLEYLPLTQEVGFDAQHNKLGVAVHACITVLRRWRKDYRKFKTSLGQTWERKDIS